MKQEPESNLMKQPKPWRERNRPNWPAAEYQTVAFDGPGSNRLRKILVYDGTVRKCKRK